LDQPQYIENVARAFYEASGHDQGWDSQPEEFKNGFRGYARDAIALLDGSHGLDMQADAHEAFRAA
jgi:hypothetical protein